MAPKSQLELREHSLTSGPLSLLIGSDLFHKQVDVIQYLQSHTPLRSVFTSLSILGSAKIVLLSLTLIFWVLRPTLGYGPAGAASYVVSCCGIVKALAQGPRPYWVHHVVVHVLDPTKEESYGFPSGHASAVVAVYGYLALKEGVPEQICVLVLLVIIGFSRVLTGAHFVHDVVGGVLLGSVVLWGMIQVEGWSHDESAVLAFTTAIVTFAVVVGRQPHVDHIPFKMVQEGLSGSGFLFGLAACHEIVKRYPECSTLDRKEALPWYVVVIGLIGIVGLNAGVKALHGKEHNIHWTRVVGICVLYGAVNLWALVALPWLHVSRYL